MIDSKLIHQALGIEIDNDLKFNALGLVDDNSQSDLLSFVDEDGYLGQAIHNKAITGLFISPHLKSKISTSRITCLVCEDPRFNFYSLMNFIARSNYETRPSRIHSRASIHPTAHVASENVIIEKNVILEPNVSVLRDVRLGENSIIRSGAVIGSEGFEYKRTRHGILPVYHDGKVLIGKYVDIGANTCVDKGFSFRDTVIGDYTKIDNLVYVGHCTHIGQQCLIAAHAMIGGSVTIGNNVWAGPNCSIANGLTIFDNARISIGAVVTQNVKSNEHVTGNFAIQHQKFIEFIKSIT